MQFCGECNHMLYPREDLQSQTLELMCRHCNYTEKPRTEKVFTRQIAELEEAKAIPWREIAHDVTLPRTYSIICHKCDGNEAVFLQVNYKDHVALYYVCAGCGHHWQEK